MSDIDLVARAAAAAAKAIADAAVPQTRTVNAKMLTGDITLDAGDVGLGNCNNTSDLNKPVSTATAASIALKANATHTHATSEITGLDAALARLTSTTTKQTELDFGTTPVTWKTFTVSDAVVTSASVITGVLAYVAPTGKSIDELEFDSFVLAFAPSTGTFTVAARSLLGPVVGKFKFNYHCGVT